jgi:hypothetical protein
MWFSENRCDDAGRGVGRSGGRWQEEDMIVGAEEEPLGAPAQDY